MSIQKKEKISSKEMGLEIALIIGRYFLKTESLHYGFWTDDLAVNIRNLPKAQEQYDDFLISRIPGGVKTILEVGCGTGKMAMKLITKGYQLDCVSPGVLMSRHAGAIAESKSSFFNCTYEALETDKKYDLILFSESFQYINVEKAFEKTLSLLNTKGFFLICDFFKTEEQGESFLGGGHRLIKYYDLISHYPFTRITDIDITKHTAPNLDIVSDILANIGSPIWELLLRYMKSNHPLIDRFLRWKFKKKLEKINRRYFSNNRNAFNFKLFKSYRCMLYQKN